MIYGSACGILRGMRSAIDSAGRIIIPKKIRDEADLKAGTPLEISWHDGHIEIEPAPLPVRLERKGPLVVAVPRRDPGALTAATVERVRESIHRERRHKF